MENRLVKQKLKEKQQNIVTKNHKLYIRFQIITRRALSTAHTSAKAQQPPLTSIKQMPGS